MIPNIQCQTPKLLEDLKRVILTSQPSHAWCMQSLTPGSPHHHQGSRTSFISPTSGHYPTLQSWKLSVHGHEVQPTTCPAILELAAHQQLSLLDKLTVCPGHPDRHFVSMAKDRKGKFLSPSGDVTAYLDRNAAIVINGQTSCETVRASRCHLLIRGTKCPIQY